MEKYENSLIVVMKSGHFENYLNEENVYCVRNLFENRKKFLDDFFSFCFVYFYHFKRRKKRMNFEKISQKEEFFLQRYCQQYFLEAKYNFQKNFLQVFVM